MTNQCPAMTPFTKRLREVAAVGKDDWYEHDVPGLLTEAADRIELDRAELDRLRRHLHDMVTVLTGHGISRRVCVACGRCCVTPGYVCWSCGHDDSHDEEDAPQEEISK